MQSMNTTETVNADWKEAAVLRLLYAVILLLKIALTAEMYKNSDVLKIDTRHPASGERYNYSYSEAREFKP